MTNATGRAGGVFGTDPCPRCDVLLGRDGVHVLEVVRDDRRMRVTVETPWQPHRVPGLRRGGGLPGPAHPGTCTTCRVRSRSPWRGVSGPGRAVTRAARSWSGVCVVDAVAGDRAGAGHAGRSRVQVRRRGSALGVDEHVWRHTPHNAKAKGPPPGRWTRPAAASSKAPSGTAAARSTLSATSPTAPPTTQPTGSGTGGSSGYAWAARTTSS